MLPPIPVLSDYGISPTHGFLPEVLPLTRLPDPYYNKWEAVAANLQGLILSRRLRGVVDRLPVLSTAGLEHDAEWRRAYSLLAFVAHGYIWGGDSPSDRLPPPLSVPLLQVARRVELPPIATYAAVCLWNFKPLFMDEGIDRLENLATLHTFTGSLDESWFYLVSVAMEARGGPIMSLMMTAIAAAREGDAAVVTRCLRGFAERLDDLVQLLQRMHESCDPTIFYHRIRPFLAGTKNMAEAGLPHGLVYDDGSGGDDVYTQYSGGSNAQSSLIQFFDIVLGIEHRPTGDKKKKKTKPSGDDAAAAEAEEEEAGGHAPPAPRHNFIMDMRRYMPGPHARFLNDVAAVANIREFVEGRPGDRPLRIAYDGCLSMLRAMRDKHIGIVSRYIVVPSREVRARSRSRSPEAVRRSGRPTMPQTQSQHAPAAAAAAAAARTKQNLATASVGIAFEAHTSADPAQQKKNLKGTGGTALISFLKQARDETGEPAVEEWTQRFMSRNMKYEGAGDFFAGKDGQHGGATEEVEVNGLAGTWTVDDDVGGICNY